MAAPSAPVIRLRSSGWALRVAWRPVEDATDYNLYVTDDGTGPGIEAQFDENDLGGDGWYHYTFRPDGTFIDVYVTALNALAEESDPSNEEDVTLT